MKTIQSLIIFLAFTTVMMSCKNDKQAEIKTVNTEITSKDASDLNSNTTYAKVEFGIDGMTCALGCAKSIEKKVSKLEGVKSAKVDFDKHMAIVEYDVAKVSPKSIEETVTKVSDVYKVNNMKEVK